MRTSKSLMLAGTAAMSLMVGSAAMASPIADTTVTTQEVDAAPGVVTCNQSGTFRSASAKGTFKTTCTPAGRITIEGKYQDIKSNDKRDVQLVLKIAKDVHKTVITWNTEDICSFNYWGQANKVEIAVNAVPTKGAGATGIVTEVPVIKLDGQPAPKPPRPTGKPTSIPNPGDDDPVVPPRPTIED